jgi:predicted MFS family arabinose efflux permease
MYVIDEWFVARKGLAFGVVWTGTGFSGAVVPWLSQWLLDTYGFRTALRVFALILFVLALPSLYVMKSRLPTSVSGRVRPVDWTFLRRSPFWFFEAGVIIQSLAYFLPSLWLPSFSASIGLPSYAGPLSLCLLNIAACGGYLIQGQLVDRYHVTTIIFFATALSAVAIFLFWGLTTSQPMLYIFSILWGLSGGGFAATWAGCANAIRRSQSALDTGLVISLMCELSHDHSSRLHTC